MRPAHPDILGGHVLLARQAWHDSFNSRPLRAPDRAFHTPPPDLSAPLEPRQPGNSLVAARQVWLGSPNPPPLHAPDRTVRPPPPNLSAPPKPRPPGPALVAAQNRLRESVRRNYPEVTLLDRTTTANLSRQRPATSGGPVTGRGRRR
jgi:hypothetical protein